MSLAMTKRERETFLADLHVAVISIPEEGRGPLTVPIWYSYEPGGELRVGNSFRYAGSICKSAYRYDQGRIPLPSAALYVAMVRDTWSVSRHFRRLEHR